jgi:beta-galactosidase
VTHQSYRIEMGLEYVRIGEFMWSTIEPSSGVYNWTLLDDAFTVLGNAGLRIILGTPTATPPSWLIQMDPSILPVDRYGRPRIFGSRRHYAFSSTSYHNHTQRIVTALATRYGAHTALAGWQLDNEYGCHDTVHSYDNDALIAFRQWLKGRYSISSSHRLLLYWLSCIALRVCVGAL